MFPLLSQYSYAITKFFCTDIALKIVSNYNEKNDVRFFALKVPYKECYKNRQEQVSNISKNVYTFIRYPIICKLSSIIHGMPKI